MQKELNFEYDELSTPFEWSYSPVTKMWYEDKIDIMPEFPIDTTQINDKLNTYLNCDYDENSAEEEIEKYINYLFENTLDGFDCFSLGWIFESKNIVTSDIKNLEINLCNNYLPLIDEFINNIKYNGYATLYIEAFSGVKLFAKAYNDKLHLVVQDYKTIKYTETNVMPFQVIYNVVTDKENFCTQTIENIRKYKVKCKNAIDNYLTQNPSAKLRDIDKIFVYWVME